MTFMKKRLLSLLALTAFVTLALVALAWNERAGILRDEQQSADARLFGLGSAAEIDELRLTSKGMTFVLARQDGGWSLREPLATPADLTVADGMASHFAELARTSKVGGDERAAKPLDLALFGLAPPRAEVVVKSKAGEKKLLVGKRNDFNGEMYVMHAGAAEVLMVPGALDYQVQKTLFDLREKRLAVFDEKAVARLAVSFSDPKRPAYVVEKRGEDYALVSPLAAPADTTQINGVIAALSGLRAKAFVSEHADEATLRARRLDRPDAIAELSLASGTKLRVALSRSGGPGEEVLFAVLLDRPSPLIEVSGDWPLRKLEVEPASLRDMRVVRFEREAVRKLEIKRGDDSVTLERTQKDGAEHWAIIGPESADADAAKVSGLLYKLFALKAERIERDGADERSLAAAGLTSPVLTVGLVGEGDKELARVAFGAEHGTQRFATSLGSGRIDVVQKVEVDEVSAKAADYKETAAATK